MTAGGAGLGGSAGEAGATGTTSATLFMVFAYDKSGSMGDDPQQVPPNWENSASRWEPVRDGLLEFVQDPGAADVAASLDFFPVPGDVHPACDPAEYGPPNVTLPMTSLENLQLFVTTPTNTVPGGGTPTWPAMRGSLDYALELQQNTPSARVVVVLITDGEPGLYVSPPSNPDGPWAVSEACHEYGVTPVPNTTAEVEIIVAEAFGQHGIRTYVIGISDEPSYLMSLHAIAAAGGTSEALLIETVDPATTRETVRSTLSAIVTSSQAS